MLWCSLVGQPQDARTQSEKMKGLHPPDCANNIANFICGGGKLQLCGEWKIITSFVMLRIIHIMHARLM